MVLYTRLQNWKVATCAGGQMMGNQATMDSIEGMAATLQRVGCVSEFDARPIVTTCWRPSDGGLLRALRRQRPAVGARRSPHPSRR